VLADEPTASLDTERANQVVGIFADLIHEDQRAGIMVTHDLRMCKYVDKVIQMVDGKIARIITDREQINALAGTSGFDKIDQPAVSLPQEPILKKARPAFTPLPEFSRALT
jgi:ABC-type phosphate/phosphonate transport system ATPase subunit